VEQSHWDCSECNPHFKLKLLILFVAGCVQTQEELGFEEMDDDRRSEMQTDEPRSEEE
jgi:hypothetical protein